MPEKETATPPAGATSATGTAAPEGRPTGLTRRESWLPSVGIAHPFSMMRNLAEEMDRLFDDFFGWSGLGGARRPGLLSGFRDLGRTDVWYPQVEVRERDGKLLVRADLPGLKKEDVRVEIQDNALILEGERRQESEQKEEGFYRSERTYGRFYRAIPLPEGVDPDKAQAHFKDGVLEIDIPVPESQTRGRKVEIT
jgi:HSP20 family protein